MGMVGRAAAAAPARARDAADARAFETAERQDRARLRTVTFAFAWMILSCTLLQRFAVDVIGLPLQVSIIAVYAALGWMLIRGVTYLSSTRLFAFAMMVSVLLLCQLVGKRSPELTSFVYLLLIYAPLCFVCPLTRDEYTDVVAAVFRNVMLVMAVLGIGQFLLQTVVHARLLFTFEGTVPDQFLLPKFNTVINAFGSFNKSNGLVFLEPSVYSQFLALAVVVEIALWRNWWRVGVFGLAIFLSFSGTGLIALLPVLPFLLLARGHWMMLGIVLALVVSLLVVNPGHIFDVHLSRIESATSGSTETSAYLRFLGPFALVERFTFADLQALLFGYGAGTVGALSRAVGSHDPTWAKLLVEYGVIGTGAFLFFYCSCVFLRRQTLAVPVAGSIAFFALGSVMLNPWWVYLFASICIFPARAPEPDHEPERLAEEAA